MRSCHGYDSTTAIYYQENISRARLSAIIADTQAGCEPVHSYVQLQKCLPPTLGVSLQIFSCVLRCTCNMYSGVECPPAGGTLAGGQWSCPRSCPAASWPSEQGIFPECLQKGQAQDRIQERR